MSKIEWMSHDLAGDDKTALKWVYENPVWKVGIKNFKPANGLEGTVCLERHNATDELFVLLDGECVLLQAEDDNGAAVNITAVKMEPMRVYKIPKNLWHNTVTWPGTKLVLIENNPTDMTNSEVYQLTAEQKAALPEIVKG